MPPNDPPGGAGGGEGPALPPDEGDSPDEGGEGHPEDSGGAGDSDNEGGSRRSRISRQTFRAAVIAGGGNRANIARATGYSYNQVDRRIAADPELNALYGDKSADAPVQPPDKLQVIARDTSDLPERVAAEIGQVTDADQQMYWAALKASGVSDRRLAKLKSLSGLAVDWATHISLSLRGHHQSYDGQLHNLADMADDIKKRLDTGELDAESYSYLAKVYVECTKEQGKGVATMLALTEALVRMMAANEKKGGGEEKATAGWGPPKKVRKV